MPTQRDRLTTFCKELAITASAKSDILDLKAIRDIAVGRVPYLVALTSTAFTDAGSDSTLTVALETDDAEAFPSAVARQTFGTFLALTAAGVMLGGGPIPLAINAFIERWGRLDLSVANGNFTTCGLTAFLTFDPQKYKPYATNIGPNF